MNPKDVGIRAAAVLWTFLPLYAVERLADYLYLASDPLFFTVSGLRLEVFIVVAATGSILAGRALRGAVMDAALTQVGALVLFLLAVYVACDPRVCFSAGPDGLEPLRLGSFLGSVSTACVGVAAGRTADRKGKRLVLAAGFSGFLALVYYPVIFTFAGTSLTPFFPWSVLLFVFGSSVLVSGTARSAGGGRAGALVPIVAMLFVVAISVGISWAYVTAMYGLAVSMMLATVAGSWVGSVGSAPMVRRAGPNAFRLLAVVLIASLLSMTIIVIPDAVSQVIPSAPGGTTAFVQGTPVYLGGYMDAPAGHASAVRAEVSFSGTSPASVEPDNFLAAGIGVHSAGCCVDGIDYAFRFDAYLFHSGAEVLSASAWEVCDDNAACGGHSWKVLSFSEQRNLTGATADSNLTLEMSWESVPGGHAVAWSSAVDQGPMEGFASYLTPPAENPNFNTGVVSGGTLSSEQQGSYFFQFGVTSGHPIESPGWKVTIGCPAVFTGAWECVQHARTLQGAESYWKVIWRWGESYSGATATATGNYTLAVGQSSSTGESFQSIW